MRKVWRPTGYGGGWRRAVRCEIPLVGRAALAVRLPLRGTGGGEGGRRRRGVARIVFYVGKLPLEDAFHARAAA